jgi:hypothetical protein
MFSNFRRLIAAAALMLAIPVMANAQTSRVEGMALQGDYIKDYTAIYGWPSQITNVGNLVYAEVGNNLVNGNTGLPSTLDRSMGAVLGNLWEGRFGTWAVHVREQTPALGQGDAFGQPNPGLGGGDPNEHTNESFDIMWGKKFGSTSLGLRLNRSFFKTEVTVPGLVTVLEFDPLASTAGDPNLARNVSGFGGGLGFELNPQTMVELAFLYQTRTFEASQNTGTPATSNSYEDDGPATYMAAARAMWQWTSNCFVMPVFKWYSMDLSWTANNGGTITSAENTLSGWQIGAAGNWQLGSNDLFVLGLSFAQNKLEQDSDVFGLAGALGLDDILEATESLSPQVFMALETHVNPWLTLRFGANKGMFQKLKAEGTTGGGANPANIETSLSTFNMNLGAGVKVGTLQFDAILANNIYQTGTWLLSGISGAGTGGYFPKVSATYSF